MKSLDDKQTPLQDMRARPFDEEHADSQPTLTLPVFSLDQIPTPVNFGEVSHWSFADEQKMFGPLSIDKMLTWDLPIVRVETSKHTAPVQSNKSDGTDGGGYVTLLRNLLKSSGLYALASVALPLISLVLAP